MNDNNEDNITKTECAVAGLGVAWLLVGAIVAGLLVGGCKSVTVEYRGKDLATWTDTNGVVRAICDELGKPVFFDKGWIVDYFQHGVLTKFDEMHAEAGVAKLDLNGYQSGVDSNFVALVKVSFDGAALLAAKIGAAIASSGGSVAADGVKSALSSAIQRYLSKGGSAANAKVTCKDGTCTITDGSVCETCDASGNCAACSE